MNVLREKWLSLNFQEILNSGKDRKNKNKSLDSAFCLSSIDFFTQISEYQIWHANTYSILTIDIIGLGPPVPEHSTRISKFYDDTDSEHKFLKISNWDSPVWEPADVSATPCSTYSFIDSVKFYRPTFKDLQQPWRLKLYMWSQNPHPVSRIVLSSKPNRHLLNHLQTHKHTHTHTHTHTH